MSRFEFRDGDENTVGFRWIIGDLVFNVEVTPEGTEAYIFDRALMAVVAGDRVDHEYVRTAELEEVE